MPQILSYPSYCPNRFDLRALLLFYDNIQTIVPDEDQSHVRDFGRLTELEGFSEQLPVKFIDPEYGLFKWEYEKKTYKSFIRLAKQCSDEIPTETKKTIKDANEECFISANSNNLVEHLLLNGWSCIAKAKITPRTRENLHELGVLINMYELTDPATGVVYQENPILMPKPLCDFAVSRLTRDIAQEGNLIPATLKDMAHFASLYRGDIDTPDQRQILLTSLIRVSIPNNLEDIEPAAYWDLRQKYSRVRERLNSLVQSTLVKHDLDGSSKIEEFLGNTENVVKTLENEIDQVSKKIKPEWMENAITFSADTAFTLAGAYIGQQLGDYQDALAGMGLGMLSAKASKFFTTENNDLTYHIAHMRAKITRTTYQPNYEVPSYMI
ncbi:MAG: hypothetical protein ABJN98_23965 [Roseibium sp.]|uniref:hypothetical protein n=1 Tax=Roseibium polysiphoniae TaxID=2571221 RepID=UPI00329934A6